jgi:hypothetical protein
MQYCGRVAVSIAALLAGGSLALGPISAQATTISGGALVPDGSSFAYTASAGDESVNAISDNGSGDQLPVSENVAPPTEYGFGGGASVAITAFPNIKLTASISNNCNSFYCIGSAAAVASLTYYFYVVPLSTGTPFSSVPVRILGDVSISTPGLGNSASVLVQTVNGGLVAYNHTFPSTSPYAENLSLLSASEYMVVMTADVAAGGDIDSASTYIDPMFSIDPDFANASDYQLVFSDGIQNDVSSTPIPAALPLFASGLGALGVFGRRRKRKNAVIAAA